MILLADETHEVCEKFGLATQKFMGKEFMGIVRTTFLFDENSVYRSHRKSRN